MPGGASSMAFDFDDNDDRGPILAERPDEVRDESEVRNAAGEFVLASALDYLEEGYRPVVLYPKGYPRPNHPQGPGKGKERYGKRWGLREVNAGTLRKDMGRFISEGRVPGVGLSLGPGRAPGGGWLADLEGDGPGAEESLERLLGPLLRAMA